VSDCLFRVLVQRCVEASTVRANDDVDASERAALQADDRETATSGGVSEMIPLHDVDHGRTTETNYVHDVVGATTTESRTDEDSDDLSGLYLSASSHLLTGFTQKKLYHFC